MVQTVMLYLIVRNGAYKPHVHATSSTQM
uniref:Uncharacterized protein n=1 Tax=Anguilla anguilla TaxID=7936 RepID=A0A0E9S1G8_ANGAN